MKEIKLSQRNKKSKTGHLVALVDDEDYEYLSKWKWTAHKHRSTFYAQRTAKSSTGGKAAIIHMHRVIINLTDPKILCDHKDRNGLNNQKSNLRAATIAENNSNSGSRKNSTSKYKGVSWDKKTNKWRVQINSNRVKKYLGIFNYETDAAIIYNQAAIEIHGEFANLNIIP